MRIFRTSLLVTLSLWLSLSTVPDASAERSNLQSRINDYERRIQDVSMLLQEAEAKLRALVLSTEPVVRQPDSLVSELVVIEREMFAARLKESSLKRQVDALTESHTRVTRPAPGSETEARLSEARTAIDEIKATLKQAEADYARQKSLFEKELVSERKYQQAEQALRAQQAKLQAFERNFERLTELSEHRDNAFADALNERVSAVKEQQEVIRAWAERREMLKSIYDECFEYQRLSDVTIPGLHDELREIELELRRLGASRTADSKHRPEKLEAAAPDNEAE